MQMINCFWDRGHLIQLVDGLYFRNDYWGKYDFDMDGRLFRDFATWVGRPGGRNDGKDFYIYGYGHAKVPVITK